MRTKGLVIGLLLSSMVLLAPERGNCVSHENADNFAAHAKAQAVAMQRALDENNASASTAREQNEDCQSYLQVFDSIESDPEHAQAKMVTPSYEIR